MSGYPYRVYLEDSRIIECDIKREGDDVLLTKRAGVIRVKANDIEKIVPLTASTTQPAASPSAPPSKDSNGK